MKKVFLGFIIGICLAAYVCMANIVLIGSLTTVNNTTSNSSSFAVGNFLPPNPTIFVQNAGLTATTALLVNHQISFDNTNFFTIATYNPSVTNATTDTWRPSLTNLPVYYREQVVTTNSVNVGVIYQN